MSTELLMLACASGLGIFHLLATAGAVTLQTGVKYNMSPRDGAAPPVGRYASRLSRAYRNFQETFPFFVAAVLLVQITNRNSSTSAVGAQLYFYARVIYIPLYFLGVPGVRTLVWAASLIGLLMVFYSGAIS